MRLGCAGCLGGIVVALGLAVVVGAALWGFVLVRQDPDVPVVVTTAEDSARAQQKVFQLVARARGKSVGSVVFTEAEVNAFVSRQLAGQVPLSSPVVRLLAGNTVELFGRVPARRLLIDSPLSWLSEVLPSGWGSRDVWLRIRAHATLEAVGPRPRLRFEPTEFAVGQLPLPTVMVRLLLDPGTLAIFRWSLPEHVEAVTIDAGRATIRVASPR